MSGLAQADQMFSIFISVDNLAITHYFVVRKYGSIAAFSLLPYCYSMNIDFK